MNVHDRVKYVIISPVRDEAAFLPHTIRSVTTQTCPPAEWIIVNDGSTDDTGGMIDSAVGEFEWIRAIHRPNRGRRKAGGGVVEAFDDGLAAIQFTNWEFLVKLDGDLSFEPSYFADCLAHFAKDPKLGIGGGRIRNLVDGRVIDEDTPMFHVRGATKIYRRACWESIGGLIQAPGWDTIDEVKAQMHGWTTCTFRDLALVHHRPTGTAQGILRGLFKNGLASYLCGYHPLFMAARCASSLTNKPYIIGSLAMGAGYLSGILRNQPMLPDPSLIKFLRTQQLRRLVGAKSIWK